VIVPFQGVVLREGSEGDEVRLLQEYLNYIAGSFQSIPTVSTTGYFGPRTREAVIAFQEEVGLPINGQVSAVTWNAITSLYSDLYTGQRLNEGQYPGFETGR
jgi:peptidoglycan hydrolase-like protein with peptidoglycan-binding domain